MEIKAKDTKTERFQLGLIIILITIVVVLSLNPSLISSWKNREKVYSLELIRIEGCPGCADLSSIAQAFSSPNLKIKEEKSLDYQSEEAKELLKKYEIKRIPALLVYSKHLDQVLPEKSLFRIEKNTAIFDQAVPYLELSSGKIKGEVTVLEIYDPSCLECTNLTTLSAQLEKSGIKIKKAERLASSSSEGKKIIQQNQLTVLPSLLLSKEISEYWWVFPKLKGLLSEKDEGYLVTVPFFPLKEISSGKIKGKVTLTILTAGDCEDCFDAKELKPSFQSLGIYFAQENEVMESSDYGKSLIKKYGLTKIPTLIFSPEIIDYGESQKSILQKLGTFESDNTFVLRELDLLQVKYKELSSGN